jgi:hypothetical protein
MITSGYNVLAPGIKAFVEFHDCTYQQSTHKAFCCFKDNKIEIDKESILLEAAKENYKGALAIVLKAITKAKAQ